MKLTLLKNREKSIEDRNKKVNNMELTRENISLYCQIGTLLDDICEKYFDKVADGDWQFYSDWGVYDDKTIRLYYYYCDYNEYLGKETTEGGHIDVKIDELIEFSKKL